jgi:hypothetical protein
MSLSALREPIDIGLGRVLEPMGFLVGAQRQLHWGTHLG